MTTARRNSQALVRAGKFGEERDMMRMLRELGWEMSSDMPR